MVFNIVVPELGNKPSNTKDAVISVLTTDWPMTLRAIFYKIRKKYGYSNSYQAVYKAVKELVEKGALLEKDKRYEINLEWIKDLQSFTDIVETNYYAKDKMQSISGLKDSQKAEDVMMLNFESIFDAEKYLYYFMKYSLLKASNDKICCCMNSEWRPLFYLRSEYNYYSKLMKRGHKFYFLCSGHTFLEELCGKFYKMLGINFCFVKEKFMSDTLVFGDYCINLFIPEEMKKKLRTLLENKEVIPMLKEVLSSKSSVRVVITKDKNLASEMKKQITLRF